MSQNLPWESSHYLILFNILLHRRHEETERTLNYETFLPRNDKGSFNAFKSNQAKVGGSFHLTYVFDS